ncbi:MAG: VOC family protein [Spirochaetales bacterium]|uniref:VOC family protein n=1 Tax=Candidatus Thalassospirochaeta sargassi TaxID=3119039 RepID=A0AAJ1MPR1_9SPIO|nr:VOC family protein [Spirochaetales bacterium]
MDYKSVNTILYCRNWNETVDFYKNGMKLPELFRNEWFVEFELNSMARISIANEAEASVRSSGGRGVTITIEITDLDQIYSVCCGSGLNPTEIKEHPWGGRVFYLFDPEGNRLEFWTANSKAE